MADGRPCPGKRDGTTCGELHYKCSAHRQSDGRPCNAPPMRGASARGRCRKHIGRPSGDVKAEHQAEVIARARVREEQRAGREYQVDTGHDVLKSLLVTYRDALLWQQVCREMVGTLEQIRYRAGNGENIRGEVTLFTQALDRSARIGADLVRLGIEARLARVAEAEHERLTGAMSAAIDELTDLLGIDASTVDVRAVVGRHLRAVPQ